MKRIIPSILLILVLFTIFSTSALAANKDYKIHDMQNNGVWYCDSSPVYDFTFYCTGPYDANYDIMIDHSKIGWDTYSGVWDLDGSTIFTLKADFLTSLNAGAHLISVYYGDGGSASATLYIKSVMDPPLTADTFNPYAYLIIMLACFSSCYIIVKKKLHN